MGLGLELGLGSETSIYACFGVMWCVILKPHVPLTDKSTIWPKTRW